MTIETALELSARDLTRIARLVYDTSGIRLHAGKRALVAARLQKRVRQGGFRTFRDYMAHVEGDRSGAELTALLDAIATNHTAFFREPQHFAFLRDVVLPPLVARPNRQPITGWSAACATGEEPYTIAITMFDALGADAPWRARVLASDLSTKALAAAEAGIYKASRIAHVPITTQRAYFERGVGAHSGYIRVSRAVRSAIEFRHLNLLEPMLPAPPFDFIFCRNVMIYFDQAAQQRAVSSLERQLAVGGYLFISHAESLTGISHGLRWVAPAVYRKVSR